MLKNLSFTFFSLQDQFVRICKKSRGSTTSLQKWAPRGSHDGVRLPQKVNFTFKVYLSYISTYMCWNPLKLLFFFYHKREWRRRHSPPPCHISVALGSSAAESPQSKRCQSSNYKQIYLGQSPQRGWSFVKAEQKDEAALTMQGELLCYLYWLNY